MKPSAIIRKAREMEIEPFDALQCRLRYLHDHETAMFEIYRDDVSEIQLRFLLDAIAKSKLMADFIRKFQRRSKTFVDEVTDDMIQMAREVPIDTIIEFKRGSVKCINIEHVDKNPSMYHAKRTNYAICGGCGVKYDSISAYQIIYGCGFLTAVRALA